MNEDGVLVVANILVPNQEIGKTMQLITDLLLILPSFFVFVQYSGYPKFLSFVFHIVELY